MHLFGIVRGQKNDSDRFISSLENLWFPFKFDCKYANIPQPGVMSNVVQMGVRPLTLWSLIFPKEQLQTVLSTVANPLPRNFMQENAMRVFRALLNAKKVPEWDPKGERRIIYHSNVEFTPIGIKEDAIHPEGGHEML